MDFTALIHVIETYRYAILFPLAFFEGPVVAFAAGSLVAIGFLDVYLAYAIMLCGDIVPDGLYFLLGRFWGGKPFVHRIIGRFNLDDHVDVVSNLWHNRPMTTMIFSKLAYGLSIPLLMTAGLVKMRYRSFFWHALIVTMAQYAVVMYLGYSFSQLFKVVTDAVQYTGLVVAAGILVGIAYYLMIRALRRKFFSEHQELRDIDE